MAHLVLIPQAGEKGVFGQGVAWLSRRVRVSSHAIQSQLILFKREKSRVSAVQHDLRPHTCITFVAILFSDRGSSS